MEGRSVREAVAAQLFADLDELTGRVAQLPSQIEAASARLAQTTQALDAGADRYRLALTAFNAEARAELEELVREKSDEASRLVVASQRAALHAIVRDAFRSEASGQAATLVGALERSGRALIGLRRRHLLQTALTSILSAVLSAAIFSAVLLTHLR